MANSDGIFSGIGANKGSLNLKVEILGLESIRNATEAIKKAVDSELKKGLFVCAKRVEKEAKISISQGSKSGRVYTMRVAHAGEEPTTWVTINGRSVGLVKRDKPHTASAPGEAPATDTGRLVNSINVDSSTTKENNQLVVTISAGRGSVKYARMLEFGTSKIAARPFMFPALEKSKAFINERLGKAVIDGLFKGASNGASRNAGK